MPAVTVDTGFINVKVPAIALAPVSEQRFDDFMRAVAEKAEAYWKQLADDKLESTAKIYKDNIKIEQGFNSYYIILGQYTEKAPLALAVEDGAPGFDMKPGLLKATGGKRRLIPLWGGHPSHRTEPTWLDSLTVKGWNHPGWEGEHLRDGVVEYIEKVILPEEVDILLNGILDDMLEGF